MIGLSTLVVSLEATLYGLLKGAQPGEQRSSRSCGYYFATEEI
jgi:hypothetical protein